MGDVPARTAELWSTTAEVVDKIRIKNRRDDPDVEEAIRSATSSVESWVLEDTTFTLADPPDYTLMDDGVHELLGDAVTYLAASEHHEKIATNISGSDANSPGTPRHVFLERRAESKYKDWLVRYNHLREESEDGAGRTRDLSSSMTGKSSSLMDLPKRGTNHSRYWGP